MRSARGEEGTRGEEGARGEEGSSGCWNGLVPWPLISCDFILTEMVSLIQIEIMKKSEVKDITPPKIQITSRELSFWGVLVYIYLSQCQVFFKKSHHICSLNPKLIWA